MVLQGHRRIRQLLDRIESPPLMVLEHVEDDLRSLSISRKLETREIKSIAQQLLEALSFAHSKNIVHKDLKPQNVLVSGFKIDATEFEPSTKLADFANASHPSDHQITPRSFRSPESWLGLPWGTASDIWSFGALIGSLLMGPHGELFGSSEKDEQDANLEMLQKQHSMTGPFPPTLLARAGGDWPALFALFTTINASQEQVMTWRWAMKKLQIAEADGAFIERVLRVDPDERPTADMLLGDVWFR